MQRCSPPHHTALQLISGQLPAILTNMARANTEIHTIILDYLDRCELSADLGSEPGWAQMLPTVRVERIGLLRCCSLLVWVRWQAQMCACHSAGLLPGHTWLPARCLVLLS